MPEKGSVEQRDLFLSNGGIYYDIAVYLELAKSNA